MPRSAKIVQCHCGYMANVDECTSLRWAQKPNKHGKLVPMVVCSGTGRRTCGNFLEPKTKEFKGLKALSRSYAARSRKEKVAA